MATATATLTSQPWQNAVAITAAPTTPAAVDYANPASVAAAYIATRFTYDAADAADSPDAPDVAGYAASQSAPALSTPTFAAANTPSAAAIAQVQHAQERCSVQISNSSPSAEAPQSATTAYVSVAFTTTCTYAGAGSGHGQTHLWNLRLFSNVASGQPQHWLVDGVVSTDSTDSSDN